MDDLYQLEILDHAEHPRNAGELPNPTVRREEVNPLCGDKLRFDLLVEDGTVKDIRFTGRGCAISQAAASMLSERIKGASVEDARAISKEDVLDMLGIPIGYMRLKCALLGLKAVKVALYSSNNQEWDDEEFF